MKNQNSFILNLLSFQMHAQFFCEQYQKFSEFFSKIKTHGGAFQKYKNVEKLLL